MSKDGEAKYFKRYLGEIKPKGLNSIAIIK